MTDQEWASVRQTLLSAFPDLMTKLSFLGGQDQVAATSRMWRETLKGCTAEECYRVIGQWVRGERDPFRPNEWDRVALIIRSRIQFDRDEVRRQNSPNKEIVKRTRNDVGFGSIAAIWEAIDAKRAGEIDDEEVERLTLKALSQIPSTDPLKQPRYDCHVCCDRGIVRVYREHTVNEIKRDPNYAGPIDDCDMAACFCSAGNSYSQKTNPYANFSRSRFCEVRAVGRRSQLAEITAWVADRRKIDWVA